MQFAFTAHYNWEWIFKKAVFEIENDLKEQIVEVELQDSLHFQYFDRFSQLPSQELQKKRREANQEAETKERIEYSLFRIDLLLSPTPYDSSEVTLLPVIRVTSPIFQRIDAKDLFYYKAIQQFSLSHDIPPPSSHIHPSSATNFISSLVNPATIVECPYLPRTILIPWNFLESLESQESQIQKLQAFIPAFPSYPAVLKAPMGSGGFGIYFVYHYLDIIEIMVNHSKRAHRFQSTLENTLKNYLKEEITLSWSLQEFIQPFKCLLPNITAPIGPVAATSIASEAPFPQKNVPQRTQIRAYLIECQGDFYLYKDYEVRFPSWDIPLEEVLQEEQRLYSQMESRISTGRPFCWEDPVEEECCGRGFGRPYNENRNKKYTFRYLLEECEDLIHYQSLITDRLKECFKDLRSLLFKEKEEGLIGSSAFNQKVTCAVIGIDLLIAREEGQEIAIKIVEVNNNPAMPKEGKLMSPKYYSHLINFHKSLVGLTISCCRDLLKSNLDNLAFNSLIGLNLGCGNFIKLENFCFDK